MRKINLTMIFTILFINFTLGQSASRYANPNYMWTALIENFDEPIDRVNIWNVQSHYKRDLGFLVDNPSNINIQNGNLELKMRYVPNYLDSLWKTTGWEHVYSNYTGAEISTKKMYRYGIYECRAKYAKQPGSWPAFWIIGGDGIPCPPGGYGNEIDIAEMFSHSPFPILHHLVHRYYPPC